MALGEGRMRAPGATWRFRKHTSRPLPVNPNNFVMTNTRRK